MKIKLSIYSLLLLSNTSYALVIDPDLTQEQAQMYYEHDMQTRAATDFKQALESNQTAQAQRLLNKLQRRVPQTDKKGTANYENFQKTADMYKQNY